MAKKDDDLNLIDDIIKDLEDYTKNIAKFTATRIRDELYDEATKAIQSFYDDYKPTSYTRNYYNFFEHSFKKVYRNKGTSYFGGIVLSPDFLHDIYRADRDLVFDLVYSGKHGLFTGTWVRFDDGSQYIKNPPEGIVPYAITDPSPMQMIEDKQAEIEKNLDKYIEEAEKKAYAMRKYI